MHLDNKKSMQNSGALNHLLYYISILVVNCNLSFEFSTSVGPWPSPAVNLKEVLFYYIIQDWAVRRLSAFEKKNQFLFKSDSSNWEQSSEMQFSMMIAQMHCHALDKKGRFLGEIAPSMSRHDKMSLTKRLLQLSADKIPFDKKMEPYNPHRNQGQGDQEPA